MPMFYLILFYSVHKHYSSYTYASLSFASRLSLSPSWRIVFSNCLVSLLLSLLFVSYPTESHCLVIDIVCKLLLQLHFDRNKFLFLVRPHISYFEGLVIEPTSSLKGTFVIVVRNYIIHP
jgi:hypothetical protein